MRKNVQQNTREKGREKNEENVYPYARYYVLEKHKNIIEFSFRIESGKS